MSGPRRPGQPVSGRCQSRQQDRFGVKVESGSSLGWQEGKRYLCGLGHSSL